MKSLFYSDYDHDDPKLVRRFYQRLTTLAQDGVKIVFLEFLYPTVPAELNAIKLDFDCCGGRRINADAYAALVVHARALGMTVHGLSLQAYASIKRQGDHAYIAFRMLGPFDGIVANIIERFAAHESFVIHLGAGHWPILKRYLPLLTLDNTNTETLTDIDDPSEQRAFEKLPSMIQVADEIWNGQYGARILRTTERSKSIEALLKRLKDTDKLDTFKVMYQDMVGLPMTLFELSYLHVRLKQLNRKLA